MQAVLDAVGKRMGESATRIQAHNRWAGAAVRVIGEDNTSSPAKVVPSSEDSSQGPPTPVSPRGLRTSFDTLSTESTVLDTVVVTPTESAAMVIIPDADPHVDEDDDLEAFGIRKSLYCLLRTNCLRAALIKVAQNVWFERASMTVIGFNCITMAMFDPFDTDCETERCIVTSYLDLTWSLLFILEMIVKVIAMGFYGEPRAYWSDPWNRLDFIIVMMSLTDFVPGLSGGPLKIIRIARVLRPLRAINKLPALRILIRMIMKTMPMLGSVASLVAFIFVVFAILGVQLFQGMLRRRCFLSESSEGFWDMEMNGGDEPFICSLPLDNGMNTCAPDDDEDGIYATCREGGLNPMNGSLSFDNVGYAWVTIFMVIGMEGWVTIMYMVQDAYSFWVWIYFIVLIMMGSLVAMNLFLVVIATQFGKVKQEELAIMRREMEVQAQLTAHLPEEEGFKNKLKFCWVSMTKGQLIAEEERAARLQMAADEKKRIEEEKKAKKEAAGSDTEDDDVQDEDQLAQDAYDKEYKEAHCFKRFVMCEKFENFILGIIVFNTLIMSTEAYGQEGTIVDVQYWLTMFCNVVFTVEMVLKLAALGIPRYCQEGMNIFDGTLVLVTIVEIATGGGGGITALRTLRLIRLVKLMRKFKQLQLQVKVLVESLAAISSFCVLLGLYMFVYTILGMFLFGAQFCDEGEDCWASRSNFNTFYRSFVTVFQLLTIEDWPGVMFDAVKYTHYVAVFYFITLLGSGTYILCNLFIAILLDSFAERAEEEIQRAIALMRKRQDKSPEAVAKLQGFRSAFSKDNSKYMFQKWKTIWTEARASKQPTPQVPDAGAISPLATLPGSVPMDELDAMTETINPMNEFNSDKDMIEPTADAKAASDEHNHPTLTITPSMEREINSQAFVTDECMRPTSGDDASSNTRVATTGPTGFTTGFSVSPETLMQIQRSEQQSLVLQQTPDDTTIQVNRIRAPAGLSVQTDWPADGNSRKKHLLPASVVETELQAIQPKQEVQEEEAQTQTKYVEAMRKLELALMKHCRSLSLLSTMTPSWSSQVLFGIWQENTEAAMLPEDPDGYQKRALICLSVENPLRRLCIAIFEHKMFDHFILLLIGLNSCTMALERRGIGDSERFVLDVINYTFSGCYVVELFVKLVALGLYGNKKAYLADGWNRLDGFLVTLSLVDLSFILAGVNGGSMLSILKIMRILRALRPLRVINKAPKLKKIVGCMVEACKSISSTLVIVAFVFLIFAIFGVNLFGGKLYFCSSTDDTCDGYKCLMDDGSYVVTKADCEVLASTNPRVLWRNKTYNWNNVGEAVLSLFYVVSLDGWVGLMFDGVDAVGEDIQPKTDNNEAMCMFYILFLIVGNFFVLNLFVGVIVDSFNNSAAGMMVGANDNAKEEELMKKEEQEEQKQIEAGDKIYFAALTGFRLRLYGLAISFKFEMFITGVIVANVLVMAMEFYDQPYAYGLLLEILNNIFSFIFFCEFVIKIIPFYPKRYFQDPWNKFDSFIVFVSFVGVFFDYIYQSDAINPTFIRVLRVFRVARIMKLIKGAKGLQALLETVLLSMGQVASIALLLFLVFFIFAAAGVQMFMYLDCPDSNPCDGIDKHAHFENWPMGMLTLFRIATGDNGNGILADALRQPPLCSDAEDCESNCCASAPRPIVPVFFILFTIMAQFILLNIVVAVLMAQLEESQAYANQGAEGLDLTVSKTPSVQALPSTAPATADSKLEKSTKKDEPFQAMEQDVTASDSAQLSMGTDPALDAASSTPK